MQSFTPRFLWKSPNIMASNPVTPPPKSSGFGLHDPFTDEKKGNRASAGKDEVDGEGSGEDTPTLFYAYARRVCSLYDCSSCI